MGEWRGHRSNCNPQQNCGPPLQGQGPSVQGAALTNDTFNPGPQNSISVPIASKHYVIYLAQFLQRGLLRHSLGLNMNNNNCN
jgi:hypothetical protein